MVFKNVIMFKNMIIKGCRFYTSLAELAQDPNLTLGTSEEATLKVIDILDQRQKPPNTRSVFTVILRLKNHSTAQCTALTLPAERWGKKHLKTYRNALLFLTRPALRRNYYSGSQRKDFMTLKKTFISLID